MPLPEQRIAELGVGTFRGHQRVLAADLHLNGERQNTAAFRGYVELARRFAPAGKWVDMGCGTGTLMQIAREQGIADIEGIELAAERLALARKVTGTTVHGQPIEALDFERGSLAAVTMVDVFSHLTSPSATLSHLRRLLAPGGIVLLHTSEIGRGARPHHEASWDLGDHLFFLGENTIERYAQKVGFAVVHRERTWMPDILFSRRRFSMKGRSRTRDVIKRAVLSTPGLFAALRWCMLKRHAGNPVYASTIILRAA
jgi:SAM-dependent methyltransferase